MASFTFHQLILDQDPPIETKTFLWIWHANKIPPHIGISSKGSYFSLKVSGKDMDLPVKKVLTSAKHRKIPLVIVELNTVISLEQIQSVFSSFDFAEVAKSTCLSPLNEILNQSANQLSELLEKLINESIISSFYGINLPEGFHSLQDYSLAEIQQRLQLLNENKRSTIVS